MSLSGFISISMIRIATLLVAASPIAVSAADDSLIVKNCSYGDTYQFAPAGCVASIENRGPTAMPLSITPVQDGNTVEPSKLTLAPHQSKDVSLRVLTENIAGGVTWTYRVDGAKIEPLFLRATGFVSSVLDVAHPEINFGAIDPAALPVIRTIPLTSSLDPRIKVTQVLSSPSFVHALIGADAKSLSIELGRDAPWGALDGMVKLALNHAQQKQVWVHVNANVSGDVAPIDSPYWVGELVWGGKSSLTVPLIDRDGHDFSIGAVTSADFAAIYDSALCAPARPGCRNLLIHVSDLQPTGLFKSNIDVELPDRKKHLKVAIWGVLGERPKPGEAAVPPAITKIPIPKALAEDGVTAMPPLKVQRDPAGAGPLLKWTIGQQQSVHGYQVLRGNSAGGPFDLMEPHVIPALENGKGPVAYRWRDVTAVKGQTYWYYVAVIYSSGDRRPLSAPQMTVAK